MKKQKNEQKTDTVSRKRSRTGVWGFAVLFGLAVLLLPAQTIQAASQNEAVAWANAQLGKGLDYDGVYGNQCVDLIKYYYAYFGVAGYAMGNANAYMSNNLPAGWTRVYGNYQPGDVAVWKTNHSCSTCNTGSLGHVGIITAVNGAKFTAVNQNFSDHAYCTSNNFNLSALACAIRPAYTSSDTERPVISNISISNVTRDGYTVTCNVSDNVGVTLVKFPSWNTGLQLEPVWLTGTISGNTASVRVNIADLNGGAVSGYYMTHIYAYDAAGNSTAEATTGVDIDRRDVSFADYNLNNVWDTDAEVYIKVMNPNKLAVTKVGCAVYDENGNLLKSYQEDCNLTTSYVNYNCKITRDLQYTLQPGTTYQFVLSAVVDGREYKDMTRSFTTTGTKHDDTQDTETPDNGNNGGNTTETPDNGNNGGNTTETPDTGNNSGNTAQTPDTGNNSGNTAQTPNTGNTTGTPSTGNTTGITSESVTETPQTVKKPSKVTGLKVKKSGSRKLYVLWKWNVSQDGYEVQYAKNRSFTSGKKTKNCSSYRYSTTLSKLKKNKVYYVRVRAYRKVNGTKVYGNWSAVKKCRVK